MKGLLIAGVSLMAFAAASRADAAEAAFTLPVKAPPAPSAYDWSGFYAGGRVGYAWGTSNWTESFHVSNGSFAIDDLPWVCLILPAADVVGSAKTMGDQ